MAAVIPPYTPPVQHTPLTSGISLDFMMHKAPELARDMVAGLDGARNLAIHYGLTDFQWQVLQQWPAFRKMVETAMQEMSGSLGAAERIKRKALAALDTVGILDAATIAGDPKVGAATRLNAMDFLKDCAGIGAKTQQPGASGGGGPLFIINLPGAAPMTIDVTPQRPAIEQPND